MLNVKMLRTQAAAIACVIVGTTGAANAQSEVMQAPIDNGEADVFTVQAGGPVWGLEFSTECMGFFAGEPSILVDATAGQNLGIYAVSEQDTTLAVQTPSGQFICNDDAFGNSNPALSITATETGIYSISAGSFDPEIMTMAFVGVGQRLPTIEDSNDLGSVFNQLFLQSFSAPAAVDTPEASDEPMPNEIVLGAPETTPRNVLTSENSTALADIKTAAVEPLSSFNEACVGTSDPYNATRITSEFSASSELIFFANGGDDLTLLVIAPDGNAACADDFAGSRNPLVSFDDIQTGAYEVYLGTYSGGEVQGTVYAGPAPSNWSDDTPASLRSAFANAFGNGTPITNGYGQLLPPLPTIEPLSILSAEAGSFALDTGTLPLNLNVDTGGAASLSSFNEDCSGFASQAATVAIEVGSALWGEDIVVEATSDTDAVMAILSPDGGLFCNDDGPNGLNPQITLQPSGSGQHKIWVGSLIEGETFVANVTVGTNMELHTGSIDQRTDPAFGQQSISASAPTNIRFATPASTETALIATAVLGCEGFVSTLPMLDLVLEPGFTSGITLRTEGAVLMRGPDDLWICDAGGIIAFDRVIPGTYRTWVSPQAELLSILPQK